MARVFVAEETALGRKVVIKVLPPETAAQVSLERFKREITLAARLQHPHIVPLHSSGESNGLPYFTMPFVEGESLRVRLARHGELPVSDAIRLLREIASALAYAHDHGIVHRDIKPDNVLLSGGSAMVTDFGVAKALSASSTADGSGVTSLGVAIGTPAYMAPEQASADPAVDHRADICAFGVLAYELLTGQPPFVGRTPMNLLAAHVTEVPEAIGKRRASLPPALASLVMRCLEKRPADRPQSAAEVVHALDDITTPSAGLTPAATQPLAAHTGPAGVTTRRGRGWVLTAAGSLLLGAAAWYFVVRVPATDPQLVLIAPFENETGDPSLDRVGLDLAERLTIALTRAGVGKTVAAARVRELTGAGGHVSAERAKQIARAAGAGLLVSGTFTGTAAALEVRIELLRMPAGRQVSVVEPVAGVTAAAAADSLGERLAVAVTANHDWGDDFGWGRDHRLARTLAAYRSWVAGWTATSQDRATASFRQALVLDPTWPWAAFKVGGDSLSAVLERQGPSFLPGDRDLAKMSAALHSSDLEGWYQAVAARLRADSVTWCVIGVPPALYTGRLHEVLRLGARRHLRSFWTEQAQNEIAQAEFTVSSALHGLGRHQEELELALAHRREYPADALGGITMEIQARAALGQIAEVERLVIEAEGLRPDSANPRNFSISRAAVAGLELTAHGFAAAARAVSERGARWFERQLAARPDDITLLEGYGDVLRNTGRWHDVLVVAQRLLTLARDGKGGAYQNALSWVGLAEAHLDHRDRALAAVKELAMSQGPPGQSAYNRVNIYVALGDTATAMDLLREAYDAGNLSAHDSHFRHRELDIPLNYPAYRELTRVRD